MTDSGASQQEAAYKVTKWTAEEQCTTHARVIYSTVLMGEEEQEEGGWHDNLQQAGDLVAMATKQGCLHQRQISAVGSGGHTCRSTNSNGGLSGPEIGVG